MDLHRASSNRRIVVMGVSGCGKSTVAAVIAERLGARFIDADDVHSPTNVAKMSAGIPLTDDDRWPWLLALQAELVSGDVVMACSALRRSYRDVLRAPGDVVFVFLDVTVAEVRRRVRARTGHFMRAELIDSQFATLERPSDDEPDVATVVADGSIEDVIEATAATLGSASPRESGGPRLHPDGGTGR
jgi:carbohydrate kinase (thermoresistant glucokinase family)